MSFNPATIRADFPCLDQQVHGKPLVFLDSAASAQKPRQVIETLTHFYRCEYANIHRGLYDLSNRATARYEQARGKVAQFLGSQTSNEIIFVRGATEGINLVAQSYGGVHVKQGDEIVVSHMEHHANIVPWQMLCERVGAVLKVVPITDAGEIILEEYERLLTPNVKLVALSHMSNALGTINPVKEMIACAKNVGAVTLIDGCQAVSHLPVDVQDLDCDFYVFSGHKLYGPSGIGVLYGKETLLNTMPPYQGGGEMIDRVTFEKTTYREAPFRFEAGTPAIAEAIGLGAAIDYITSIGKAAIAEHENGLLDDATQALSDLPNIILHGTAANKAAILSFTHSQAHPSDIGMILDQEGIAIRAGHHCAQPLMERLGQPATARISFGMYNNKEDVEAVVRGLEKVDRFF